MPIRPTEENIQTFLSTLLFLLCESVSEIEYEGSVCNKVLTPFRSNCLANLLYFARHAILGHKQTGCDTFKEVGDASA